MVAWTLGEERPATLDPYVRSVLARVLKPAEAALRRLIFLFIKVNELEHVERPCSGPLPDFAGFNRNSTSRPLFNLIDPRPAIISAMSKVPIPVIRDWEPPEDDEDEDDDDENSDHDVPPRIWHFGDPDPQEEPEDLPDPTRLLNRLEALDHAIRTLPRQARRMLKEIEKRKSAKPGLGAVPPIRIGEPPGYRKRSTHDVDDILRECATLVQEPIGIEKVP